PKACLAAARDPVLLATDLADYLVRKGVPFRQAHHSVGALVALAERQKVPFNKLTLDQFRSVERKFEPDVLALFDLNRALNRRNIDGAPGTKEVRNQLARWKKLLG